MECLFQFILNASLRIYARTPIRAAGFFSLQYEAADVIYELYLNGEIILFNNDDYFQGV